MANIKAPNNQYDGKVGGVKFIGGTATTTDEHMIKWFGSHGYEVVKDAAEENLPVPDPEIAENWLNQIKPEEDTTEDVPIKEPKPQEAAEEAPAEEPTPKKSRKGS